MKPNPIVTNAKIIAETSNKAVSGDGEREVDNTNNAIVIAISGMKRERILFSIRAFGVAKLEFELAFLKDWIDKKFQRSRSRVSNSKISNGQETRFRDLTLFSHSELA